MNVLSLFDGISCGQIALNRARINYDNYYASEIDEYAIAVTQSNYPNTIQLGNVADIDVKKLPKIDLLIGGSPCQGFSFAGKQLNFNDHRSKLFFQYVKILHKLTMVNPDIKFLLENVKMKKEYLDVISEYLGVSPVCINSSLVSAQNRIRYYWTNISLIRSPQDKNIYLKDVIKEDYDGILVCPRGENKGGLQGYKGKSPSITTSSWEYNFKIAKINRDGSISSRMFTPEECEQLQTIPVGYTKICSKTRRIKQIGNAWTVDIIVHILKDIKNECTKSV